jgi:uncharacterized protein (TIGR02271 family)
MSDQDYPVPSGTNATAGHGDDAATTLSQEVLHVGTEWAEAGQIRLRRRIVTETRTVEVSVRREELVVDVLDVDERRGAFLGTARDGRVSDEPDPRRPLVIVLQEEVPEVSVRLRPYERVTVATTIGHRTGRVTDDLRHEEAHLDTSAADLTPREVRVGEDPAEPAR